MCKPWKRQGVKTKPRRGRTKGDLRRSDLRANASAKEQRDERFL
jgi:hypothetical protein